MEFLSHMKSDLDLTKFVHGIWRDETRPPNPLNMNGHTNIEWSPFKIVNQQTTDLKSFLISQIQILRKIQMFHLKLFEQRFMVK